MDEFLKDCPFCAEPIRVTAVKCKHCNEYLDPALRPQAINNVVMTRNSNGDGVAALLSLLIPGAGHMYKGKVGTGIVLLLITACGYAFFIVPGLVMHLIAVASAYSTTNANQPSVVTVGGVPQSTSTKPETIKATERENNMAALISLFLPGAGHAYKGHIGLGIVIMLLAIGCYFTQYVPLGVALLIHLLVIVTAYAAPIVPNQPIRLKGQF